jgi:hypothetical protein
LRREITDNIGRVPSPKRPHALLRGDSREAIRDTRVPRDFPGNNSRVRVLRLDQKLDAFDRGGCGFRDRTGDAASR